MDTIARPFIAAAGKYLADHPELIERFAAALADKLAAHIPTAEQIVDELTDRIPGDWDDKILDPLVAKLTANLPGQIAQQIKALLRLPF